ncbi:MAG: alpha/beta fold hydrolase [Bacteroidia bacterium]|nr:alpha/beta fold hydrolase [Bacteroidia bacterium]
MRKLCLCLLLLGLIAFAGNLFAQNTLPRQATWGAQIMPLADSTAQKAGLPDHNGVLVIHIFPGSTAESLQIKEGDIILEINQFKISDITTFRKSPHQNLREGDKIEYLVWRDGKKVKLKGKVVGKPLEKNSHGEVIYSQVPFEKGYLRTLITRPNKGKGPFPVLFLIPGYNCATYDNLPAWHPYAHLVDSLTALGYAVFRVEKSGMGDCQNTPSCFDMDFHQEQKVWEAGLKKLLEYDFIDKGNIFLFGHSLGGLQAPILAQDPAVKGVAIYGTTHLPWSEYLTTMLRFQNPRSGVDYLENEKDLRTYKDLLYQHYVLGKDVQEVAQNPDFKLLLDRDFMYDGGVMLFDRNQKFWQDIENLNMTRVWAELDKYVLSLFGEADFEALTPDAQKEIVRIVNQYHPGKGEFQLVEGTDHGMIKVGSMEDGIQARNSGQMAQLYRTSFNFEIITRLDQWMKGLMKRG